MDSLTQIVLGASVGEAVLGKKVGNKAMLWGAIAGTIPDLDVFVRYFTDEITSTELHRGVSHSLLFSIVMAFVLGWLIHKLYYKKPEATRQQWSWLFFWTLVTHPILDAHTTWGTQFFWPFEYRIAHKNIFVADPLYTVPFLIFVLIAMFYKRTNPKRAKFNRLGLIISTSYMVLTLVLKWASYNKFEHALQAENISYVEMDTRPTPLNTILWNAQVETETGYKNAYYSFFDSKPIQFQREIPKNRALLNPYKNEKVVQQLIKISDGWYFVEQAQNDTLLFTDIRFGQFGLNDTAPYLWQYKLFKDKNGNMQATRYRTSNEVNFGEALSELYTRIKGN